MPGYSTSTGRTRPQAKASKRQQIPGDDVDLSGPKSQPQQNKRRCSPASTLAAAGAKRKRSEQGTSASHGSQTPSSTSPHTTGIASVNHAGIVTRSDQQKATKSPARPSAKPSKGSKRKKLRPKVVDSEHDPDDEVPLYTLAQKQKQKPATPLSRQSNSREHANGVSAASRQRNAAAAASAAGFLGGGRKTDQRKPAALSPGLPPLVETATANKQAVRPLYHYSPSGMTILFRNCVLSVTGRLGAPKLTPSRGLTDLVSRISNPSRQPEAGLPPKPPTSHYDIYKNLSDQACRNQETQLSLVEAPFRDAAKSGVASIAYFEPGFLTSPFR